MDYKKLQNGSDIRGVALEGIAGQSVNLTEEVCRSIGRGFALWLCQKTGKGSCFHRKRYFKILCRLTNPSVL